MPGVALLVIATAVLAATVAVGEEEAKERTKVLTVAEYVELSLDLSKSGARGWEAVVSRLRESPGAGAEGVRDLMSDMLEEQQALLRLHGASEKEFRGFLAEHQQEVDDFLKSHPAKWKAMTDLAVQVRNLVVEYQRLVTRPRSEPTPPRQAR